MTVRQAIEDAEGTIAGRFAGQPEVEAAIRDTLTNTYYAQGEYEKARVQGERVLALRKSYLDPDDAEVLSGQSNLALANLQTGRFAAAEELLRATLAGRERKFGPDHPATLGSKNSFAGFLIFSGRLGEAADLLKEVLAAHERADPPSPDALHVRGNLSNALAVLGRFGEAEPLVRAVLAEREKTLSADNPDTILTVNTLIDILRQTGRLDEAGQLAERSVASCRKTFGKDSPKGLAAHLRHFQVTGERDLDRAVREFREFIDGTNEAIPAHHPDRLVCLSDWAIFLLDHHRPTDAAPWVDEVLDHSRQWVQGDSPLLATVLVMRAECRLAAGTAADAETDAREA